MPGELIEVPQDRCSQRDRFGTLVESELAPADDASEPGPVGPGLAAKGRGETDVAAPDGEQLSGIVLAERRGNDLWVTDITEYPTREGKVSCATALEVLSRRVVGWSIDSLQTAALATNELSMAITNRPTPREGYSDPFRLRGADWAQPVVATAPTDRCVHSGPPELSSFVRPQAEKGRG